MATAADGGMACVSAPSVRPVESARSSLRAANLANQGNVRPIVSVGRVSSCSMG